METHLRTCLLYTSEHLSEGVTVALDPYDMADKANIFSVHYNDVGLMPIFLVISNDGNQPVSLLGMKAELITVDRTKIPPATEDDIYRRIAKPPGNVCLLYTSRCV